jgi:UDP-galactopyranose mutase
MTLYQVYGAVTPEDARNKLQNDLVHCDNPTNMEEFCLANIGRKLYQIFIEGYTQKQWGIHPSKLPADIIKRIPFRLNFDDNYFNDKYQGIPIGGYTKIAEKLLEGVPLDLNVDFFSDREQWLKRYDRVIYTGEIDRFFDHEFGILQYRSLRFERELLKSHDWQGNAVINYTDASVPWTRILEHKHFDLQSQSPYTVITREYPDAWTPDKIPFYPINDDRNNALFDQYRTAAESLPHVHFGGRLGSFRYYDMHQVIGAALTYCEKF